MVRIVRVLGVWGLVVCGAERVGLAQDLPPTGRVVDEAGKAVAGAVVGARDAQGQPKFWWSEGKLQGVETDATGSFRIESDWAGGAVIAVVPGRGCSTWTTLAPGTKAVVLTVVPGNVVEGTVRDATRQPLAGIEVTLATAWEHGHHGPAAVTDAKGKFRFAGVLPGIPWALGTATTPRVIRVAEGGGPLEGFAAADAEALLAQESSSVSTGRESGSRATSCWPCGRASR